MMPEIKDAIDLDRPLFDFARMWLTVVGFWVLVVTILVQLYRHFGNDLISYTIGIFALVPPLLIAIVLTISLMRATERISRTALTRFTPRAPILRWIYGPVGAYVVALSPAGIGIAIGATIFTAIK